MLANSTQGHNPSFQLISSSGSGHLGSLKANYAMVKWGTLQPLDDKTHDPKVLFLFPMYVDTYTNQFKEQILSIPKPLTVLDFHSLKKVNIRPTLICRTSKDSGKPSDLKYHFHCLFLFLYF